MMFGYNRQQLRCHSVVQTREVSGKLSVVDDDMNRSCTIYAKFLEFQSLAKIATWCIQSNIRTREDNDMSHQHFTLPQTAF